MTEQTITAAPAAVLSRVLFVLEHALDGRCDHCFRPIAPDELWGTLEGGERPDLCWEEGQCAWSFDHLTREGVQAQALADAGMLRPEGLAAHWGVARSEFDVHETTGPVAARQLAAGEPGTVVVRQDRSPWVRADDATEGQA